MILYSYPIFENRCPNSYPISDKKASRFPRLASKSASDPLRTVGGADIIPFVCTLSLRYHFFVSRYQYLSYNFDTS